TRRDWKSLVPQVAKTIEPRLPSGLIRNSLAEYLRTQAIEDALAPGSLVSATRALCARYSPDVVVAEYAFATPCLSVVPKRTIKIIDTHDVFSRRRSHVVRYGIDDRYYLSRWQERRYLLKGDVVIAIQHVEAELLAGLVPEREVIEVGVDFPSVSEI